MTNARLKVLFVAEAVTLAHVARPLVMAHSLDLNRYEVHIASASGFEFCYDSIEFPRWTIDSVSPQRFMDALAKGKPLYDFTILKGYVEEELDLLDRVRPNVVVGDFRLSLAVSAVFSKIPYVAAVNAHWSPYANIGRFPVPDLPAVRLLGERLVSSAFQLVRPMVFAAHARPLNRLRKTYGLCQLGDMRSVYTWGDHTLYLDVPKLVPTLDLPANHHYIGPAIWTPDIRVPPWWVDIPEGRPCVYVTMGSSGPVDLLPRIIKILGCMPVTVLLATAGRACLPVYPDNVLHSEYLPGSEAVRKSVLVVCNGGSATVYQALAEGVPVLGIASNMDQHLTMGCVDRVGAGIRVRSDTATPRRIGQVLQTLLGQDKYRGAARQVRGWFTHCRLEQRFPAFLEQTFGRGRFEGSGKPGSEGSQ